MDEGETYQLMGGQWAETEKGGSGSLNTSHTLQMLWQSQDWKSNKEPSQCEDEPPRVIAFSTSDSKQDRNGFLLYLKDLTLWNLG